MQAVKQVFFIFLIFSSLCWLSAPAAHCAEAWTATVESVGDGDSFKVRRKGRTVRVRLYGIDSPEFKQRYGYQARQLARRLLPKGGEIEVYPVDRDHYGRVVALVRSGGTLVNQEMVCQGAAWVYPRYCRERRFCAELKAMQDQARNARLGLWEDDRPLPPWEWKRRQLKKGVPRCIKWVRGVKLVTGFLFVESEFFDERRGRFSDGPWPDAALGGGVL